MLDSSCPLSNVQFKRFYSWRRYCNKHQIRLGGYEMEEQSDSEDNDSPRTGGENGAQMHQLQQATEVPPALESSLHAAETRAVPAISRGRSPSPPRMLFRSTTGKGVAFTEADVTFLVRCLEYYR